MPKRTPNSAQVIRNARRAPFVPPTRVLRSVVSCCGRPTHHTLWRWRLCCGPRRRLHRQAGTALRTRVVGVSAEYGRLRGFTRASDAAPPQRAQHSTFCRSLSLETVVRASTNYSCTRTLNPLHRTRTVLVLCLRNCVHSIPPYCEHSTQCAQS